MQAKERRESSSKSKAKLMVNSPWSSHRSQMWNKHEIFSHKRLPPFFCHFTRRRRRLFLLIFLLKYQYLPFHSGCRVAPNETLRRFHLHFHFFDFNEKLGSQPSNWTNVCARHRARVDTHNVPSMGMQTMLIFLSSRCCESSRYGKEIITENCRMRWVKTSRLWHVPHQLPSERMCPTHSTEMTSRRTTDSCVHQTK